MDSGIINTTDCQCSSADNLSVYFMKFDEMSPFEVYETLRQRTEIFVLEQTCLYQDLDGRDQDCVHVLMFDKSAGPAADNQAADNQAAGGPAAATDTGEPEPGSTEDTAHTGEVTEAGATTDAGELPVLEKGVLVGYLRVLPPGQTFDTTAIGRVIVPQSQRRKGNARRLMIETLRYLREELKIDVVKMSAQQYLTEFYETLGFVITSEPYLEDDIPHIEMTLKF